MVSELLDMLQKTEQSLARVRRNKPADSAAAGNGSELSNIQKISLQLFLDVQVRFRCYWQCSTLCLDVCSASSRSLCTAGCADHKHVALFISLSGFVHYPGGGIQSSLLGA
jgi:hypothetical protein